MLNTIYYENNNDILEMDFSNELLVICPNPTLTDIFRESTKSKYEVITIAKWISNIQLNKDQKQVGKSELMLRVASAWRNYFSESSLDLFLNSFEIFTEIRSYTLDLELALNLILDLDSDVQKSVKIFWAVLQSENLIDEHLSYELKKATLETRPILFLGFKHLSSIQIDLIKEAASSREVFLYFPMSVKSESLSSDWINWLATDKISSKNENVKSEKISLEIVEYPSKKLNLFLNATSKIKKFDLITSVGNATGFSFKQELILSDFQFKESIDLFKVEKIKLLNKIEKSDFRLISDLLIYIESEKKLFIKSGNYLALKVAELLIESLNLYKNYHEEYSYFVHKVIATVLDLNTPRNYFVSIDSTESTKIINFSEAKFLNNGSSVAVILSKDSSPFKAVENKYPEELLVKLKAIGPVKRGGFELLLMKNELIDLLRNSNSTLFIEAGMSESDLGVRDLEKYFLFNNRVDLEAGYSKKAIDPLINKIQNELAVVKTFSSSKLQTFYDCPRKYYFSYVEKMDISPDLKMGIGPDEKGTLEHAIIESYFQNHTHLELNNLKTVADSFLNKHLEKNKNIVDEKEKIEVFYELVEYSYNGLEFLFDLKSSNPSTKISFERELTKNSLGIIGYIDCLVEFEDRLEIYDFKRSDTSVGSKTDLQSFEKLQLWIYGLVMSSLKPVKKIGYINVSDTKKNLIIETTSEFEIFEEKILILLNVFKLEKKFLPNPRKDSVCDYCNVRKICPKGVL